MRFVYSPRLNEQLIGREGWAELIINACRFHRGSINRRRQSPHTASTVWICHWSGEKRNTIFFFLSNGRCFDGDVLTGIFQLIFLNSIDGMLAVRAQSKYKQQM